MDYKGTIGNVHPRRILSPFRAIVNFMYLEGCRVAEGGRAKATEVNIVEVGPPRFGCAESTEGEKGGATITIQ